MCMYNTYDLKLHRKVSNKIDHVILLPRSNLIFRDFQKQVGDITPVLNSFAKILALSQENTPESRLAILELIQSIGNVSTKIIENAKTEVENQIKEEQKDKQDTIYQDKPFKLN